MMNAKMFGVIFDVDGVLIDSYRPHRESWRRMLAKDGLTLTDEAFHESFGRVNQEIVEMLWDRKLPQERIDEIDVTKEALYRELVEHDFPAMPGAAELIRSLHAAGIPLAIGSSAPRENVDVVVNGFDIGSILSGVVCKNDVRRGKPDPEIFLRCAEKLNLPPNRCVVIEDSVFGIEAAKAAGMRCVGFMSSGHRIDEYTNVDKLIHSLSELTPDVLRHLI